MNTKKNLSWPSGDCKAILATEKTPEYLVAKHGIHTFRDRDDLDWFCGAELVVDGIGLVLIMKHDNNPKRLTALYVDKKCESSIVEDVLIRFFDLDENDLIWRLSADVG